MNDIERKILDLEAKIKVLLDWKRQKEIQQISFPLDLASKNSLGVPYGEGAGSTAKTQTVSFSVSGNAETVSISVPKAYAKTLLLVVDGIQYEIPSLI